MKTISDIGQGFLVNWGNWTEITLETVVENRVITALNFFVVFSALVAVILIVAAGYMFMTSAGDSEKVEKAQKALTAAVVGMVIVFLARVIIGFVISMGEGEFPAMAPRGISTTVISQNMIPRR